jgi:uncharacterized protein YutE (UPF0331/DUF86 family)
VPEVNLDRLRDLAGHLRNALRELREIAQAPRETFLRDSRTNNSAKYLLIVATEAALDICNHLAARRGGRSPEDYVDCIHILAEIGAIDAELRNWKVDDAEVYRVLQEDLRDLDEYLLSIGRYLGTALG